MFPDSGPTARALITLELLQNHPGATATQIAERLGVSERAARRSITTLREIGLPVESVRGPHGGYRLGRGLRLPPLMFSTTEALGLVMAVLDGVQSPDRLSDPVGGALAKLVAALPERLGRPAALMVEHAASASRAEQVRADPGTTSAVVAAVAAQTRIEVGYRTQDRQWRELVDPWAVVVRFGKWYLLCYSHRAEAVRTYRIDRITDVADTGFRAEVPHDLDAVAVFRSSIATGWKYPVRVRFGAPLDEVTPWIGPSMGSLAPDPDDPGCCVLEGSASAPEAYAGEWLAPIPFPFTIEEGPELIAAMRGLVGRLAAAVPTTTAGGQDA